MMQHLIRFAEQVDHIALPQRFTFPFYYDPHPLAMIASRELQDYLIHQSDFIYDFGLDGGGDTGLGKMFGVLVVEERDGSLGYLAAYSGKLGKVGHLDMFVPAVYDMHEVKGRFVTETAVLSEINKRIISLKADPALASLRNDLHTKRAAVEQKISMLKKDLKRYKQERKAQKVEAQKILSSAEYAQLHDRHNQESINDNFLLREYTIYLKEQLAPMERKYAEYTEEIDRLQSEMASRSIALQDWLFDQYQMLNVKGECRSVKSIFANRIIDTPPSGAGDCAAPKLLQYAFLHGLRPVTMAEFWWGRPPASMGRKHGYFYPACRGKCEPILSHMLEGMEIDPNPLLENLAQGKELDTVYEDEYLVVINKPSEFMSVPGKVVIDSVQERMKVKYPDATGPMIVHRLDMSTSGLMVVAKTKDVHELLQRQFKSRSVEKRYVAVLDGEIHQREGYIHLPLRVDIDNRPYQIVCEAYGKKARTRYEVVSVEEGRTRIHFYPITGRTHQLRVHASHHLGLNAPIIGDDLYGQKAKRLLLHAEELTFAHPMTGERITVTAEPDF